jgi:hypothetical protein
VDRNEAAFLGGHRNMDGVTVNDDIAAWTDRAADAFRLAYGAAFDAPPDRGGD